MLMSFSFFFVMCSDISSVKQCVNSENYRVQKFCCRVPRNIEHTEPKIL